MKKKAVRWIVPTVIFIMCGLMIMGKCSEILRRKVGKYPNMMHVLYNQTGGGGTADVVCVGSSHGYWSFQANCLWGEYGITGLCMCSPRQSIANSYYVLKEILKYEKPKVVLLESYYFHSGSKYVEEKNEVHVRRAIDGLRLDEVKHEVIQDFYGENTSLKDQLPYYIPLLFYHSRWQELEDCDFNSYYFLRGSMFNFSSVEMQDPGMPEEPREIAEVNYEYFDKIYKLCKENGIQLVVYAAPMSTDGNMKSYRLTQGLNLTLESYLKEKGIPFLFYQKIQDISLDFSSDFIDATHLNTGGGIKVTKHLGAWLQKEYNLEDHRGDYPKYQSYEEDYEDYMALFEREEQIIPD